MSGRRSSKRLRKTYTQSTAGDAVFADDNRCDVITNDDVEALVEQHNDTDIESTTVRSETLDYEDTALSRREKKEKTLANCHGAARVTRNSAQSKAGDTAVAIGSSCDITTNEDVQMLVEKNNDANKETTTMECEASDNKEAAKSKSNKKRKTQTTDSRRSSTRLRKSCAQATAGDAAAAVVNSFDVATTNEDVHMMVEQSNVTDIENTTIKSEQSNSEDTVPSKGKKRKKASSIKKKKEGVTFLCEKCDIVTDSRRGYLNHVRECNPKAILTPCPYCGAEFFSLRTHLTRIHGVRLEAAKEEVKQAETEKPELTRSGRTKRKATERAEKTLKEVVCGDLHNRLGEESDDGDASELFVLSEKEEQSTDDEDVEGKYKSSNRSTYDVRTPGSCTAKQRSTSNSALHKLLDSDPNNDEVLYKDWRPVNKDWVPLTTEEKSPYLHKVQESPYLKLSQHDEGERMKVFSVKSNVLYAGGPVWGLAWAPRITGNTQYLAVTSRLDDQLLTLRQAIPAPSIVQIWKIEFSKDSSTIKHSAMMYGVAGNYGTVLELKWCPLGAAQSSDSSGTEGDKYYPRLGLLAMATSSGMVPVYSLPYEVTPECLSEEDDDDNNHYDTDTYGDGPHLYTAEPATCLLPTYTIDSDGAHGSCYCVDWKIKNSCRNIIAGYSDGSIRMWDLSTTSPLLIVPTPTLSCCTLYLAPSYINPACNKPITSIAFCQTAPHIYAFGCLDRSLRIWDSKAGECIQQYRKSNIKKIQWPTHQDFVYFCSDDCFSYKMGGLKLHYTMGKYADEVTTVTAAPINCTQWDIDFNDSTKVVAVCDNLGDVQLFCLKSGFQIHKKYKLKKHHRFAVTTDVACRPQCGDEDMSELERHNKAHHTRQYSVYMNTEQKQGLRVQDRKELKEDRLDRHSLAAMHRTRWCPCYPHRFWLACGGYAGFITLVNTQLISSTLMREVR